MAPAILMQLSCALWWLPRGLPARLPHAAVQGEADPPTPETALQPQRAAPTTPIYGTTAPGDANVRGDPPG